MSREKVTTNEQFLNKLVESQVPVEKQIQNLESLEQKITNNIKNALKQDVTFYFGGSKTRNTMLKEKFDSNIIVYWPQKSKKEPQEIYEELNLSKEDLALLKQANTI